MLMNDGSRLLLLWQPVGNPRAVEFAVVLQ